MSTVLVIDNDHLPGAIVMQVLEGQNSLQLVGLSSDDAREVVHEVRQRQDDANILIFSSVTSIVDFLEQFFLTAQGSENLRAILLQTNSNLVHVLRADAVPIASIGELRNLIEKIRAESSGPHE